MLELMELTYAWFALEIFESLAILCQFEVISEFLSTMRKYSSVFSAVVAAFAIVCVCESVWCVGRIRRRDLCERSRNDCKRLDK